jgi:hypothetical protein
MVSTGKVIVAILGFVIVIGTLVLFLVPAPQRDNREKEDDSIKSIYSTSTSMLTLKSPAFENNGMMPAKYTCDLPALPTGQAGGRQEEKKDISPPLSITDVPEGAQSLALIMTDPDVPKQLKPDGIFDHWVVYNIKSGTSTIKEGESLEYVGQNGRGETRYTSPCPPTEYEPSTHRYVFKLYALDTSLNFTKAMPTGRQAPTKQEVEEAIAGHIISETELIGIYHKQK